MDLCPLGASLFSCSWALCHRDALHLHCSHLEFQLHQLKFLSLLAAGNMLESLAYANVFGQFSPRHNKGVVVCGEQCPNYRGGLILGWLRHKVCCTLGSHFKGWRSMLTPNWSLLAAGNMLESLAYANVFSPRHNKGVIVCGELPLIDWSK